MPLGLYVHFPFCPYLCNYCDYFKVLHLEALEEKFFDALIQETKLVASELKPDAVIDTLFIGGGTPSLANLKLLENWLSVARICFHFAEKLEFSIECNIDSVDVEKLSVLKELGVTRPSLGMQSFHEQLLKAITRPHSPRIGHQVVYHAHVLGFKSFNVDMLFGIPGQTSTMLLTDIAQLIDMEPPHISLYQLVVEPGTQLAESIESGALTVPDEPSIAVMYHSAAENLTDSGYEHYEISSFALPGHQCRHNLNYWQGGEYIGLGPSAHSYLGGRSYANVESVGDYIKSLSKNEIPRIINESALMQRADDTIMSGLRLKRGIDRQMFVERFGIPLDERIDSKEYGLLIKNAMIIDDGRFLRATDAGFFQADAIARRLLK
ncbi:MAG TPA: radical SAM family heme chaperone HemW [candidate division Zixibacteria bacterium]|nr:radical SAM family heme chaperone HemW [candidate division Zixibacteria bacterium]